MKPRYTTATPPNNTEPPSVVAPNAKSSTPKPKLASSRLIRKAIFLLTKIW